MRHLALLLAAAIAAVSLPAQARKAVAKPKDRAAVRQLVRGDSVIPELPSFEPKKSTLPPPVSRPTVGLVLSGGGAKGIAHVGVIKALEDNDIPIDYVTGTSMGAIVGSLYSCGWSPQRMIDFFTKPEFLSWASGNISKNHIYYYNQPDLTPKWAQVNFSFTGDKPLPSQIIPTSLVSPLPMNIEFLKLFGPYSEQCGENFNRLFVPFRCVASDIYHKHKVVFGSGSLGQAVRASMSFPMVYRPIKVDGLLLYDGGIYDNFPVNVMEESFNPDFIIGVSVSGADSEPIQGDMYSQLEDMIIQNNDYTVPADKGMKIQVPVLDFGVLAFNKARTIYDIGYKTGLAMVDSIKSRVPGRMPLAEVEGRRSRFAAKTPALEFDTVKIEGVEGSQARYLRYLFMHDHDRPFGMDQTVNAYYRAVTDGSLSNLVPELDYRPGKPNVLLLKATPRRPWSAGIGGYVTTSTNSMLYMQAGYHTLGLNSLDVSLGCWLGQSYFAGSLSARFAIRSRIPSYFEMTGVLSKQKYYDNDVMFFKSSNPMFISEVDNFLRGGYVWAIGHTIKGYANIAGGYMSDAYYPWDSPEADQGRRDLIKYRIGVVRLGVEGNTLDNQMFPSEGRKWYADLDGSLQWSQFYPGHRKMEGGYWKRRPVLGLEAYWEQYFPIGRKVSVGLMANGAATLRRLDQNYTNTLVHAPAFAPTPATKNYFNTAFRSENYAAAGVIPIWKPLQNFQLRGSFFAYQPIRNLKDTGRMGIARYDGWYRRTEFIGEVAAIYNLPFASVSAYCNYLSSPARNWNFGISIGLLFQAPHLLRR